jgi:hypothetical protein
VCGWKALWLHRTSTRTRPHHVCSTFVQLCVFERMYVLIMCCFSSARTIAHELVQNANSLLRGLTLSILSGTRCGSRRVLVVKRAYSTCCC